MRLRSIEAQLSAGSTLCRTMEATIGRGGTEDARNLLGQLRHTLESVRRHLDEPHHVPQESLAEARDQLAQLETQVLAVEKRLSGTS